MRHSLAAHSRPFSNISIFVDVLPRYYVSQVLFLSSYTSLICVFLVPPASASCSPVITSSFCYKSGCNSLGSCHVILSFVNLCQLLCPPVPLIENVPLLTKPLQYCSAPLTWMIRKLEFLVLLLLCGLLQFPGTGYLFGSHDFLTQIVHFVKSFSMSAFENHNSPDLYTDPLSRIWRAHATSRLLIFSCCQTPSLSKTFLSNPIKLSY